MQDFSKYKFEDVFTASDGYASRFSGAVGSWLLSVQEETILSVLNNRLSSSAQMLDVGGAHGQLIPLAAKLNKQIKIAASHQDAISFLKARINQNFDADAVSDLFTLPYQNNSFELVSSVRLISHCEPWQNLILELCRVSSRYVLIDYPPLISNNLLNAVFFPLKKKLEGNTRTFRIFKHSEVDAEFNKNGYKLVVRKGQFFWPMVVHRKLKNPALSRLLEWLPLKLGLTSILGNPDIALYQKM